MTDFNPEALERILAKLYPYIRTDSDRVRYDSFCEGVGDCEYCKYYGHKVQGSLTRRATHYDNEISNYSIVCDNCAKEEADYYADLRREWIYSQL